MDTKQNAKDLLSKLQSADNKTTLGGIEQFRVSGSIELLPVFIDFVLNNQNTEIAKKGMQVLYDLKDEGAVHVVFDRLKDIKYLEFQQQLTAVLWEAGMNCDDRLEDLVAIAITGTTNTLLEILTVIENIDTVYSFEDIGELKMNIIETMEDSSDELKNQLLNSLCVVLDGMVA
jgi:hypothetical protein